VGIFILDDGVGLVAKRLEIIRNTNPQMLRKTLLIAAINDGLMRYISSGVWYGLRAVSNWGLNCAFLYILFLTKGRSAYGTPYPQKIWQKTVDQIQSDGWPIVTKCSTD